MIDISQLSELLGKEAAMAPGTDPGSQAMAAAASMARPAGAPPLPKPIKAEDDAAAAKQEGELAKLQAQAQRSEEKHRKELSDKDKKIAELESKVQAEHTTAMKADAMREIAVERAKNTTATAKERMDAHSEMLEKQRQGLEAERDSLQRLADIRDEEQQVRLETQKKLAEEESSHIVRLAQQQASSVERLSKMKADSYMKATQQASKLKDKYIADAKRETERQRASVPAFSPALKSQLDGAISALNGVQKLHKSASAEGEDILPMCGEFPVFVKRASMQGQSTTTPPQQTNPSSTSTTMPQQTTGASSTPPSGAGSAPHNPGSTSSAGQQPGKINYDNYMKVRPDMADPNGAVAQARQRYLAKHGDDSANPAETAMAAAHMLSQADMMEQQGADPSEVQALRSRAHTMNQSAQAQVKKLQASKGKLTSTQQSWLDQWDTLNKRHTNNGGLGWLVNIATHRFSPIGWLARGASALAGTTWDDVQNKMDRWSQRNLGLNLGSSESAIERARYAGQRQANNWAARWIGGTINGAVGIGGDMADAVGNMYNRYQINSQYGTDSDVAKRMLKDTGIGESYWGDVANLGVGALSLIPGLGMAGMAAKGALGAGRVALGAGRAAAIAARGKNAITGITRATGKGWMARNGGNAVKDMAHAAEAAGGATGRVATGMRNAYNTVSKVTNTINKYDPSQWVGNKIVKGLGMNPEGLAASITRGTSFVGLGLGAPLAGSLLAQKAQGMSNMSGGAYRGADGEIHTYGAVDPNYLASYSDLASGNDVDYFSQYEPYESGWSKYAAYRPQAEETSFGDHYTMSRLTPLSVEGDNPYNANWFTRLLPQLDPYARMLTGGVLKLTPDVMAPQDDPRKNLTRAGIAAAVQLAPLSGKRDTRPALAKHIHDANAADLLQAVGMPTKGTMDGGLGYAMG